MTRTEAGRDTFDRWSDVVEDPERLRADILAIEAEAAARDAERVVRDMRYHPSLSGKSEDYIAGWDAAAVLLAEAAAGPRDVPVLPPPDMSLIDTLGEGTDPDRPVRIDPRWQTSAWTDG